MIFSKNHKFRFHFLYEFFHFDSLFFIGLPVSKLLILTTNVHFETIFIDLFVIRGVFSFFNMIQFWNSHDEMEVLLISSLRGQNCHLIKPQAIHFLRVASLNLNRNSLISLIFIRAINLSSACELEFRASHIENDIEMWHFYESNTILSLAFRQNIFHFGDVIGRTVSMCAKAKKCYTRFQCVETNLNGLHVKGMFSFWCYF